jgi:hypothetical protein
MHYSSFSFLFSRFENRGGRFLVRHPSVYFVCSLYSQRSQIAIHNGYRAVNFNVARGGLPMVSGLPLGLDSGGTPHNNEPTPLSNFTRSGFDFEPSISVERYSCLA